MLRSKTVCTILAVLCLTTVCRGADDDGNLGFTDTPFLPNSPWRVHDRSRPQPPVVEPGKTCGQPPSDAVILFDGKDLSQWEDKNGSTPTSGLEDGCINILKAGDLISKPKFGDCQVHIEWATPAACDTAKHHWWGNSGIFFLAKYELQVTESHDCVHKADGQAGAVYGQTPPLVNAARKPGEWQVYDVIFTAPQFEGEKVVKPAYFTAFWNGVLVQYQTVCMGSTRFKTVPTYNCFDTVGPLKLQQHGSAVRFRNIWVRPFEIDGNVKGPAPSQEGTQPAK